MTDLHHNIPRITLRLLTNLFSKIQISTTHFYKNDPCWEWIAFRDKDGYGRYTVWHSRFQPNIKTANWPVHRLVYQLFVELIPHNLVTDHLCVNRCCVNPAHLEIVIGKINTLRGEFAPAAINARKTHCSNGHPFTSEHLATSPSIVTKIRKCRTCYNEWQNSPKQKARKLLWERTNRQKLKELNK